jgi:hypothetical protein
MSAKDKAICNGLSPINAADRAPVGIGWLIVEQHSLALVQQIHAYPSPLKLLEKRIIILIIFVVNIIMS